VIKYKCLDAKLLRSVGIAVYYLLIVDPKCEVALVGIAGVRDRLITETIFELEEGDTAIVR
jgi:hypothetical protein